MYGLAAGKTQNPKDGIFRGSLLISMWGGGGGGGGGGGPPPPPPPPQFVLQCASRDYTFKAPSEEACTVLVHNLRQLRERARARLAREEEDED